MVDSITNDIKADVLENILSVENELDFNDANNKIVKTINKAYPRVLNKLLQEYRWTFAGKFQKLEPVADDTDARYKYRYALPDDFLMTRGEFRTNSDNNPIHDKVLYPNGIHTNESVLYLSYTAKISETLMPDYFIEYFMFALAERICLPLTGDYNLLQTISSQATIEKGRSKRIDARRDKTRKLPTGTFLF
jgi:hypothetical protein